jgi:hypothetical protein
MYHAKNRLFCRRKGKQTQYIEDMKAELLIYIRSTHPSVTEEMRECAKSLLD